MNDTEKVLERLSRVVEDKGRLPAVSDYETLEAAILRYGSNNQIDMAIEEMSELTKALLKERRQAKKSSYSVSAAEVLEDNIAEEMADVTIVLIELQMMYGNKEKVTSYVINKVERLKVQMETEAELKVMKNESV